MKSTNNSSFRVTMLWVLNMSMAMTACLARDLTLREPRVLAPEAQIAAGKSQSWTFPGISPKPDEVVVLRFLLRMDTKGYGGCNFALNVSLNGKPLTPRLRNRYRLLSHPRSIHLFEYDRTIPTSGAYWLVMYAPDFQPKQVVEGEDCLYLYDVTDLVRAAGNNELTLEHHGEMLSAVVNAPIPFMIKDMSVGLAAESEAYAPPKTEKPLPFVPGLTVRKPGYEVTVPDGGGMEVKVGSGSSAETFFIDSRFTFPNAGWNCLSPSSTAAGEAGWKPRLTKSSAGAVAVEAEGSLYRLKRSIVFERYRVIVNDEITNKTQSIIGMRLRNQVNASGQTVSDVYVGGNNEADDVQYSLDNPTLFIKQKNAGLGLLADDDVYRVQSAIYREPPFAGIGNNEFGLGPGKSYTMRWAIYPTRSGDAFDFINRVRRDWGVNDNTIDGPGVWLDADTVTAWSDEKLSDWLMKRSAKVVLLGPWLITLDIPHIGSYEKFQPLFKSAIERIHRIRPGTKVLCLIHPTMNFCKPGQDYDSEAYKDSFILNPDGTHFWSDYYSKSWFSESELKEGWRNYCNFAVAGNSYFPWLMRWIDRAMDECGADGIYSDEFNHFNNVSATTYGEWDGHSVKVDPKTFVPETSKLFCRLIYKTEATQQAIVDRVTRNGGLFLANSHPGLASLQRRKFLAFCEIGDLQTCYHTQLFTPIGLGWSPGYGARKWSDDADVFQNIRPGGARSAVLFLFPA